MDALDVLIKRQSPVKLGGPAPDDLEIAAMYRAAMRAPDHGKLKPWRIRVLRGAAIAAFGEVLVEALRRRDPAVLPAQLDRERQKAARAPLIVVVGAHLVHGNKIPEIEQTLAAGAAAQNIVLAAHAQGFGALWRTGAPAYDNYVKEALGFARDDQIVGIIYIGTPTELPPPLVGGEPDECISEWVGPGALEAIAL